MVAGEAELLGVQSQVEGAVEVLQGDPVLALAALLSLLVFLVVLWLVIRRVRRSPGERLRRLLAGRESVAVLMHPNPDPDAMAGAQAVGELADSVDTEPTLYYPGEIRHQQNRAFQTVLDLDFEQIQSADDIDADAVVLVDHNTPRNFDGAERIEPMAVIDHHPGNGTGTSFTDVRTGAGACASIFAEYFEELGWEPVDPDDFESDDTDGTELPPTVATGLLYGIQSDTSQLTKGCSRAEFDAAAYLYPGIDADSLDRIATPEVDADVLDIKARAINERDVRNPFAVSDVGTVSNVDAIPQAADELRRLEGVTAVVVFGDKDGNLHVSGRSRDDRVHMGKSLESLVKDIPMAEAGGHARMGGGQLSLDHMAGIGPSDGLSREEFVDRIFDVMAGEA